MDAATLALEVQDNLLCPITRLAYADSLEEQGQPHEKQRLIGRILQKGRYHRLAVNTMPDEVRYLLKRLNYRKRTLVVSITTSVTLSGGYWDEGSKNDYQLLDIRRWSVHPMTYQTSPFASPLPPYPLNGQFAVVQTGWSRGKPATLVFHVHPDDCAIFLAHLVS